MQVHTLCFSPTQTGAAIAQAVQRGFSAEYGLHVDLTTSGSPSVVFEEEDLLIVGMPVYSGRLPALAVERFKKIKGSNTPVVAVVIYGNRAYDDALLELSDLCVEQGFQVIATAAFIGEHSFSSKKHPIAVGRPDAEDLEQAKSLGLLVQEKLNSGGEIGMLSVPGNRP